MTDGEQLAMFTYYRELGRRMGISGIPETIESFEAYNREFESARFRYRESNVVIGTVTRDMLLGFYLWRVFWPLGRPVIDALLDEPLRDALRFPAPPAWVAASIKALFGVRARILRLLPESTTPRLGTKKRRKTYPKGYEIEKLGTFPTRRGD